MIKLFATVLKKDDISYEDFYYHWLNTHGKIVCGSPKSAPSVRKYIQSHTLREAYTEEAPGFDGIAELWFDDLNAMNVWFNHPYYHETVHPDEIKLFNLEKVGFFITQEILMDNNPIDENMIKVAAFLRRKPGMSLRDFYIYWQYNHGEIVMSTSSWDDYIRHYVQSHVFQAAHEEEVEYDGFPCVWFDDVDSFRKWAQHPDVSNIIQEDEKKFLDRSKLQFLITREHNII